MLNLPNLNLLRCHYIGHINLLRALTSTKLKEYYDVLQADRGSSPAEIKQQFLKLSKVYHPDNKNTGSHTKFVKLKEAFDAVKDGPPATSFDSEMYNNPYSSYSNNYDFSHKAYAKYRQQNPGFDPSDRFQFGGRYSKSNQPWEDFTRDRDHYRQQSRSGSGQTLISVTILFSAVAYMVIFSSIIFIIDYKDHLAKAIQKQKYSAYDYESYEKFIKKKREERVSKLSQKQADAAKADYSSAPSKLVPTDSDVDSKDSGRV